MRRRVVRHAVLAALLVAVPAAACRPAPAAVPPASSSPAGSISAAPGTAPATPVAGGSQSASPAVPPTPTIAPDAVLVGAGDIASCDNDNDEATARLLDEIAGTVFVAGDLVYDSGTPSEFAECYGPTWGRHRERTRPAPGNHDYETRGALGYFDYFGASAGDPSEGWYAYDLGAWRIYSLNSNCWAIGGCDRGSRQESWLREDLASNRTACALAYWHHPRFSSGHHGNTADVEALWRTLWEAGADVVVAGHDHTYERFGPQDPDGRADPARGIHSFVVGTGGRSHYSFRDARPNSEARDNTAFGVLELTLRPTGFDFRFVPVGGAAFRDFGSADCH